MPWERTTIGAMIRLIRLMTLINGFSAGPAVSFSGSPTVSPTMLALCASEPLPPIVAFLHQLLGVIPRAAGVRHEHRQQLAGEDDARQEAAQRLGLQREADDDRDQHDQDAHRQQLALRGLRGDRHGLAVVRHRRAFAHAGHVEFLAHHGDHAVGRAGHGLDQQRAEQERDRAADQQADEDARISDVDARDDLIRGELPGRHHLRLHDARYR